MRKIIDAILFYCLYALAYMASLLPMKFLYKLSNIAYIVVLYLVSYRKAVVIQNLSRSFPEMNYKEIRGTMKEFYHSFTDNLVEILKTVSITFPKQAAKITLINFDIVTEQIKQGKSVIASMGHCGNWEIMNFLPSMLHVDSYAVYKPLRIKAINRFFLVLRSRFGMKLIPAKSVARHFISNKNNPSLYFFIADQCPKIVEPNYRFDFLHQETSTFSGIEKLAHSTGAIVVYIHVIKTGRGIYNAECKMVCADSKSKKATEITQGYLHLLEANIQAQPSGWLWTHKRWKR